MKVENARSAKIKDAGLDTSSHSRVDLYWHQGVSEFYKKYRKPALDLKLDRNKNPYEFLLNKFHFKSLEFGNWVNNETRTNYLAGASLAFYDINKVLGFDYNLGLDKTIGLGFGSRGAGRAIAHFEPGSFMINLTRNRRGSMPTESGGMHALAHEYGHALDYFFATYAVSNPGSRALSFSNSTSTKIEGIENRAPMVQLMDAVLQTIIWTPKGELTPQYKRIKEAGKGPYFKQRNEMFARAFEQYVHLKLARLGIVNKFLTNPKYTASVYILPSENAQMARMVKAMDALLVSMRAWVKDHPPKAGN